MDFIGEEQWTLDEGHLKADAFPNQSSGIQPQLLMPVWAYHSAGVYLICISVMGLMTNVIVVVVILNDPQRMTPLNWMLLNLACSDGTIAGFGTTISTAAAFHFGWPFGDDLCVAYAMIMSTAGIGSITTLTALALWRCQLVVCCPSKRSSALGNNNNGRLSHGQAVLLLAIIWTYSLAVTCPPLFGWGRYDLEASHISCSVNWESKMDNNRTYIFYMFAVGLFVPLVIIIVSYVSILRVIQKTSRFRRRNFTALQQKPNPTITADLQEVKHPPHLVDHRPTKRCHHGNSNDSAEKRVTVMVACMVGAFMTAWTPYATLALFETFISERSHLNDTVSSSRAGDVVVDDVVGAISPALATIPSLFAKTSSVLNPLIYGLLNTQFRSAWEKFRFRCRQRRFGRQLSHEAVGVNVTGRRLRQLLDFSMTVKPSFTANLPMTEIVPILNNDSHPRLTPYPSTPLPSVEHPALHARILRHGHSSVQHGHPRTRESGHTDRSVVDTGLLAHRALAHRTSKHGQRHAVPSEQPVKLVVVRLLSDSTSCCYTTDETLVDDASRRSPVGRSSINDRLNQFKINPKQPV